MLESNMLEAGHSSKNDILTDPSPVRFYCVGNTVVAIMEEKAKFCFTGKLVVKVIYGAIEAYGCVINAKSSPIEIYSPRGYSNVTIRTSEKFPQHTESDIWMLLSNEGIDRSQKHELVAEIKRIQPGMAVLLLFNIQNLLTKFLQLFYSFRLFPKVKTIFYSWTDLGRAETILQSNIYVNNYACKELIVDPTISQELVEKMLTCWRSNKWSCTLIAGGKNVGKSTAVRYLINSLLPVSKKVVLLDIDPGQAECTMPACISYSLIEQPLMGPNFTHLKTPVFHLYIGDVDVSRCLTRYIEGIKILIDKLLSCPILSRLPIVVNTMGWTRGLGWDIIMFAIKSIRPAFVVQITSEKLKNNFIGDLSKQVVNRQSIPWNTIVLNEPCDHELLVVDSHAENKGAPGYETWNMEPYQQRELVIISYFSELVQDTPETRSWYDMVSINEVVPYVTSFASLCISVPEASVPSYHVLNVLNGNIVALCGIDIQNNEQSEHTIESGLRVLKRVPLCSCYGFGIVRGVDMEQEEIFVNTPLPASTMQQVNCLVRYAPVPNMVLQLYQRQKNVAYIGGNDVLPMSREHRRGYFRMRYQKMQNNYKQDNK